VSDKISVLCYCLEVLFVRRKSKNGGLGKCAEALNSGLSVFIFHIMITVLHSLARPRLTKHKVL